MKRSEAIAYLTHDKDTGEATGHLRVPCSRYGRTGAECAPVAYRAAFLIARECGEPVTEADLEYAMYLTVNDHDDIQHVLDEYGD